MNNKKTMNLNLTIMHRVFFLKEKTGSLYGTMNLTETAI